MPNLQERLESLISQAEQDALIFHEIIHQGSDFTTIVESGEISSVQKRLQDIRNEIIEGADDILSQIDSARDVAVQAQQSTISLRNEAEIYKNSAQSSEQQAQFWAEQASVSASGLAQNIHYNDTNVKEVLDSLGSLAFLSQITLSHMQAEIVNLLSQIGDEKITMLSAAPENWIFEEGQELARNQYPQLWNWANSHNLVIPHLDWEGGQKGLFSGGDGTNTFRIPDLRGQFIRIHDNGAGIDLDAALRVGGDKVGSSQLDEVKEHTHTSYYWNGAASPTQRQNVVSNNGGAASAGTTKGTWISDSTGGVETRPKNINRKIMIRYQ